MRNTCRLVHLLRNTPVREIISYSVSAMVLYETTALEPADSGIGTRMADLEPIHYHTGGETLIRKTLASVISATQWTEDYLRRLGLV